MKSFIRLSIFSITLFVLNVYAEVISPPQLNENSSYVSSIDDNLGNKYLVYQDGSSQKKGQLLKYNDVNWSILKGVVSNNINHITGGYEFRQNELAVDSKNKLHIAYIHYDTDLDEGILAYDRFNPNSTDKTIINKWETRSGLRIGFYEGLNGYSSSDGDFFYTPLAKDLALDVNSSDIPFIAYIDQNTNKVSVRYLDDKQTQGTDANSSNFHDDSWEDLGSLDINSSELDMLVDKNIVYLAYKDTNAKASVIKYENNSWVNLASGLSDSEVSNIELSVQGDDNLYLSYVSNNKPIILKLRRYKSVNTDEERTNIIISLKPSNGTNISYSLIGGKDKDLFIISNEGNLSFSKPLSYEKNEDNNSDGAYEVDVKIVDNDTSLSSIQSLNVSLNDINDAPQVASTDITIVNEDSEYSYNLMGSDVDGDDLNWSVKAGISLPSWLSLNSSNDWENIGSIGFSAGSVYNLSMAMDHNGTPYVVYMDGANSNKASVMKYNGTSWEQVGNVGFSAGQASQVSIIIDSNNIPYVAYQDAQYSKKVSMMKYNGTSWEQVGDAGFSAGQADYLAISIDSNNNPYVAYRDKGNRSRLSVMRYKGNTWEQVGDAGFTSGGSDYVSLAIDKNDTPYVSYNDSINSGKASVMKYNGTSWVQVGIAGFSASYALDTSIAVDSSGIPYVAYKDFANSNKVSVMKYNGTSWVQVGSAGFTSSTSDYISIVFDSSSNPYVAYSGTSSKANVMKYNGSSWVQVGNAGFSTGGIYGMSIVIDSSGTPYVAYSDSAISAKTRVMKFNNDTKLIGTPANDNVGVHDVNLTLSDGNATIDHSFQITVRNTNDAASSSNFNTSILEDTSKIFALNDFNFSDVDVGDSLDSIIITSLESIGNLKLNGSDVTLNQEISKSDISKLVFTPVLNGNGSPYATFGFKVNDGESNSSSEYTATINVTAVDDTPSLDSISNLNKLEDASDFNITLVGTDVDGDTIIYTVDSNNSLVATVSIVDGKLQITPVSNASGVISVEVNASANGKTDTKTFTLNITAVDDAPVLSSISNPSTKNEDFSDFNITLNSSDVEGDSVSYNAKSNNSDKATVSVNGNILTIKSVSNAYGNVSVDVNVTQDSNTSLVDSQTINFTIDAVNDKPTFLTSLKDIQILEDNGSLSYDINVSDIEGSDLNITIDSNNTNLIRVSPSWNGLVNQASWNNTALDFNLTTVPHANGIAQIRVILSDGDLNSTALYDINVSAVNDAPVLRKPMDINKAEDFSDFNITLVGIDVENDTLNYNAISNDTSKAIVSITDNILTISSIADANGRVKIDVNVSDGILSDSKSFNLNIGPVDDKPRLKEIENQSTKEDGASIRIKLEASDIDSDASTVSYSVGSSDDSKVDLKIRNGELIVIPKDNANGVVTIEVNASVGGQTITQTFNVNLTSINDRPNVENISDIILDDSSSLNDNFSFSISDDVNVTSLTATSSNTALLSNDNLSVSKDSQTSATLTYTITDGQTGNTRVSIVASDGELSFTETFNITVRASDDTVCVSDTKTNLTFDSFKNANIDQEYVTSDLSVPSATTICNASISWKSSDTTVIKDDGSVIVGSEDKTVTITATITKGQQSTTKQFLLTVRTTSISNTDIIDSLSFEMIKNKNRRKNAIVSDLNLVSSIFDQNISWSSDNTAIIDPFTGVVSRDSSDVNVSVTATLDTNSSITKTFTLTVLAIPTNDSAKIAKDKEWLGFDVLLDKNINNENITYNLVKPLPTSTPNGSTITWTTSNSEIITTNGDVFRDDTNDRYVKLTATFALNGEEITESFTFKVLKVQSQTSTSTVNFKRVEDNNDSLSVVFDDDSSSESNTTINLDSTILSKIEKTISDDRVESIIEFDDRKLNLYLNTDGTSESSTEVLDENNNSVRSSVTINLPSSKSSVDENGSVDSNVSFDSNTLLKTKLNSDGSVEHTVEATNGSTTNTSKASSNIAGSKVEVKSTGEVETTSEIVTDTTIIRAIATTDKDGNTKTKFVTINLTTGEQSDISNTLDDSTPYPPGNEVEISEIDGTVYIKTTAPLDGNLSVK